MKRAWAKENFLWSTVVAIGILLLGNIYLIYQNSFVIEQNRMLQVEAESIKVNTLDISRNLHLVDMGARGYTLIRKEVFKNTLDNGLRDHPLILAKIRKVLSAQNFPMKHLEEMKV
jgi:CHASE3 domain sensor protein